MCHWNLRQSTHYLLKSQLLAFTLGGPCFTIITTEAIGVMGWFTDNFHEWHSHDWTLLANQPTSDQTIVIQGKPYFHILFYFLHAPTGASSREIDENSQWPRHCLQWVNCVIVTSCTHTLWRHFGWLFSERFYVGYVHFPTVVLFVYHLLII